MTFTTEILFFLVIAFVVLGPKSLQALFIRVVRAKAEFDKATRTFQAQLAAELDSASSMSEHDAGRAETKSMKSAA